MSEVHTHCNAIHGSPVGELIVMVEGRFAKCDGIANGRVKVDVVLECPKDGIDMVHGRDDLGETWCGTREEECRVLEDLRAEVSGIVNRPSAKTTYLQHVAQVLDDTPVGVVELVRTQASGAVGSKAVDGCAIVEYKHKHVVCRIPTRADIARDKAISQLKIAADLPPGRKVNGRRVDDNKGKAADLKQRKQCQ